MGEGIQGEKHVRHTRELCTVERTQLYPGMGRGNVQVESYFNRHLLHPDDLISRTTTGFKHSLLIHISREIHDEIRTSLTLSEMTNYNKDLHLCSRTNKKHVIYWPILTQMSHSML